MGQTGKAQPSRDASETPSAQAGGSVTDASLTAAEKRTLALVAAGRSNRDISQELGLAMSSVGTHLGNVLRKVGLEGSVECFVRRADVPRALQALPRTEELTDAERGVLRELLRGRANAEIASKRGTAERTVANQVQCVFRKLGVSSRRQLWALAARELAGESSSSRDDGR